jgi:hypothetical protein
MWERSAANFASERSLQSTDFVLEILSLLTQSAAFVLCGAHGLDSVANALYLVGKPVAHDGEVWWKGAVIIEQQDVFETFGGVAANVLSHTV